MEIKLEPVCNRIVVHPCGEAAGASQHFAIQTNSIRKGAQFVGRAYRMAPAPAADGDAQVRRARIEAAFERAHYRGGDARRMPVHPHHTTECLKPEWIAETSEKFGCSVGNDDVFRDGSAELSHPFGEPSWYTAAVQRKVGCSGALHDSLSALAGGNRNYSVDCISCLAAFRIFPSFAARQSCAPLICRSCE